MKYIFVIIVFAISLAANPIYAGQNEYDDCLLRHLRNAKVDVATQLIIRACRENYEGSSILSDKRQRYNECLLEYLPGMESGDAVLEIEKVCRNKHL
jgi:hypothetical protein